MNCCVGGTGVVAATGRWYCTSPVGVHSHHVYIALLLVTPYALVDM